MHKLTLLALGCVVMLAALAFVLTIVATVGVADPHSKLQYGALYVPAVIALVCYGLAAYTIGRHEDKS